MAGRACGSVHQTGLLSYQLRYMTGLVVKKSSRWLKNCCSCSGLYPCGIKWLTELCKESLGLF